MDTPPTFLATLGLLPPVTAEDVKQAYLERVKTAHPDKGGTREQFQVLQEDYQRALEYAQFFESRRRWISSAVERHMRQEECVAVIRRLEGDYEVEQLDWLAQEIGPDFAQLHERLVSIDLAGCEVDDDDLAELATHEESLAAVRRLDLSATAISDAGLESIAAFPGLEQLALDDTAITSTGAKSLQELTRLSWLGLRNTGVGWLAVRSLKRALPEVDIQR